MPFFEKDRKNYMCRAYKYKRDNRFPPDTQICTCKDLTECEFIHCVDKRKEVACWCRSVPLPISMDGITIKDCGCCSGNQFHLRNEMPDECCKLLQMEDRATRKIMFGITNDKPDY